jgi:hypothetical protein
VKALGIDSGIRTAASRLGFDYDDVPFEFPN